MASAEFIYVADVFCPWCYAFGPVVEKLTREHPEFPVRVYGGDLVSRSTTLLEIGARDQGLASFWAETAKETGRSFDGALAALRGKRDVTLSSPNADRVFEALKTLAPGHELEQFIALEDTFFLKGEDLFSARSIKDLAVRWNLEAKALADAINSDDNARLTAKAMAEGEKLLGDGGYPTLYLQRGNRLDAVTRGYCEYAEAEKNLGDAIRDLKVDAPATKCSRKNCQTK